MRILHTSDWHLGQKFNGREREEEHRQALEWLAAEVEKQKADLLIAAGDVFDVSNPPNSARSLYYRFLTALSRTNCRNMVIIGGNHDSAQMLEAPQELLKMLGIHVVGAASDDPAAEVILLRNAREDPEAVIAAVPFLRDQDLRKAFPGESLAERTEHVREGIRRHYEKIAAHLEKYTDAGIPIIATGHLYATGAQASSRQDNIYLGNLENIAAADFPAIFDYVALGHIHRPQAVGAMEHIRYSGSLIPLSFSETKDEKEVVLIEFQGRQRKTLREIAVPVFRRLKTFSGPLSEVMDRLRQFHEKYKNGLPAWVEVQLTDPSPSLHVADELQDFVHDMHLDLLAVRLQRPPVKGLSELLQATDLAAMAPEEVFLKRCESECLSEEQTQELLLTFRELREWMANEGQ